MSREITASILSIGDELLIGQTVNTNAAWIGGRLSLHGIRPVEVRTIGDDRATILRTLEELSGDLVLITGGLGPTKDDITKDALCEFFDTQLVRHTDVEERIVAIFNKLGREKQKALMRYALYLMRQCVLQWQGAHPLVVVAGEERDFVEKFATLVNERNIPGIREELEIAHYHLERNANPKVLFMDLSYRMMGLLRA